MMQKIKYHMAQQYDLVLSYTRIHKINTIWHGVKKIIFHQDDEEINNNKIDALEINSHFPSACYSRNCKRKECKNWNGSIASGIWNKYVSTLQRSQTMSSLFRLSLQAIGCMEFICYEINRIRRFSSDFHDLK